MTDDVVLRQTQGGLAVCNFTVAVQRQKKDETDFIRCSAWSKLAELMDRYTGKGCLIGVCGRISTRSYTDKDGKKVNAVEIVAEDVQFLEYKKNPEDKFVNTDGEEEFPFV